MIIECNKVQRYIMKTTVLTFLSRSCSFYTVDEYGDAKMSSPGLKMADLKCKPSEKSMLRSAIHKITKTGISLMANYFGGHFLFHLGCGELLPWRK